MTAQGNDQRVSAKAENIALENLSIERLHAVYTPKHLVIKIPLLIFHDQKFEDCTVTITWADKLRVSLSGPHVHVSGIYDECTKKIILNACNIRLDKDIYKLVAPSEVWPVIKDVQIIQGNTTHIHIQNLSHHPLRCDTLIVHKFPLKYINERLQDSLLSVNLKDFTGDFLCQLPNNMRIIGTFKNDDQTDSLQCNIYLKNAQKNLLEGQGTLKDFYLLHNAQLNMTCKGQIDLATFSFLLPGKLRGHLKTEFHAHGPLRHLDMGGHIALQDGYFEDIQNGVILENVRTQIDFLGDKILLKELYCHDHSEQRGTITAKGQYNLGTDTGEIRADVKNFQPMHYTPVYVRVSGPIIIKMTPQWSITGKLTGRDLLVQYDQFKKPYHRFEILDAKNPHKQKKIKLGFIQHALINMVLEGLSQVKGKALKSTWAGKLNMTCLNGKWQILGQLDGQKGELLFLGKKMKMRLGKIIFDDKKDPRLNMAFDTAVTDHKIIVTLKGRGREVRTNVSAEPALHTEDAYAYLLFGTSKQSLSNFQTAKLFTAIAAANTGSDGIVQKLTSLIDIRQKQQSNGQDEDVLRFSQALGEEEKTALAFEQSLSTKDISAKVERQLTNNIKADLGIVSNSVKRSNFGGEVGLSFGKNY